IAPGRGRDSHSCSGPEPGDGGPSPHRRTNSTTRILDRSTPLSRDSSNMSRRRRSPLRRHSLRRRKDRAPGRRSSPKRKASTLPRAPEKAFLVDSFPSTSPCIIAQIVAPDERGYQGSGGQKPTHKIFSRLPIKSVLRHGNRLPE